MKCLPVSFTTVMEYVLPLSSVTAIFDGGTYVLPPSVTVAKGTILFADRKGIHIPASKLCTVYLDLHIIFTDFMSGVIRRAGSTSVVLYVEITVILVKMHIRGCILGHIQCF